MFDMLQLSSVGFDLKPNGVYDSFDVKKTLEVKTD